MNSRAAKLTTLILAGTCAVLLLAVVLLEFGVGSGYVWNADADAARAAAANDKVDRNVFKLDPIETYAEIDKRPLFNDDRKPTPPAPAFTNVENDAPPVVPLKVRLSGILLTSKVRIAMISDDRKNPPTMVKEGMPLPGDLNGWTLTKIEQRSAVFKGSNGENDVTLKLEPGAYKAPPPPPTPAPGANPAAPGAAQAKANAQAAQANPQGEDLQQRIEERRKQIREQNERMREQNGGQPAPQPLPAPPQQQTQATEQQLQQTQQH